jgi:hypothetical protein
VKSRACVQSISATTSNLSLLVEIWGRISAKNIRISLGFSNCVLDRELLPLDGLLKSRLAAGMNEGGVEHPPFGEV